MLSRPPIARTSRDEQWFASIGKLLTEVISEYKGVLGRYSEDMMQLEQVRLTRIPKVRQEKGRRL